MARYKIHTHKSRSVAQKAQAKKALEQALAKRSGNANDGTATDSHTPPTPLPSTHSNSNVNVDSSNKQLQKLKIDYKNALLREKRAKKKVDELRATIKSSNNDKLGALQRQSDTEATPKGVEVLADSTNAQELDALQAYQVSLEKLVNQYSQELATAYHEIETQNRAVSSLKGRQIELHRSRDAMRKKIQRLITRNANAKAALDTSESVLRAYQLKDKSGAIQPEVRDLVRKLVCKGVSTEYISDVINIVAEALGIQISGSVSARSVARVMLEGLVQARIQVGHELSQADYISICGDGTTIKNVQHEAKSLYLQVRQPNGHSEPSDEGKIEQKPIFRTLGVQKAINHTAESQLQGWIAALDSLCSVFTRSSLGQKHSLTSKMVAPKLRGVLTDHAADQKRFFQLVEAWKKACDRQARAVPKLQSMSTEEQLHLLSTYLDDATNTIGDWQTLPAEQQAALMHDAWFALASQIGEAQFQQLDPKLQGEVDFLAWVGCCMHKELNAVKGGVGSMAKAWESCGLTPPIALKNKFEAAKLLQGQPNSQYMRGAVKLASLAGALFNNKDDKKGYQSTVDHFFERTFGYSKRFPDTSNTRYGSYCDAAAELILNLDAYTLLLTNLRNAKTTPGFTNLELNVFQALQDTPTLTELVVLALYSQAVGRPYMRYVRAGFHNAFELARLHAEVREYCQAIAERPELLIAQDTTLSIGAFDGQPWERPEVVYKILSLHPKLPNLYPTISAFFTGALQTWERFTVEFDEGGVIAQATSGQRASAWLPPTNDVSEGLLGQSRQMIRRAPTMTDNQRNARVMWPRNGTYEWAKATLSPSDERFIRHEARTIDSSGDNKKLREEMDMAVQGRAETNQARQTKAAEKKSSKKSKLALIELLETATYEDLAQLKVLDLNDQIDKLRESGDLQVRAKSTIGNKQAKIKEILAGLDRRRERRMENSSMLKVDERTLLSTDVEDLEECPEDVELYHDDEPCF